MPVSEATYRQIALEDQDHTWELHCGRLVEKPPMAMWHNSLETRLATALIRALPESGFEVRQNSARLRVSTGSYFVPDVAVIPDALKARYTRQSTDLEVYDDPVPFVAEIRSPSTAKYDVGTKIPEYQARGDLEIWRVDGRNNTVTAFRRQPDGSYASEELRKGRVPVLSLPGVTIDLDRLFA